MAKTHSYWLVKSEPTCFSIHDLANCPRQTSCWSGVRNYQARNMMRDQMKVGDRVLFYHSSADPPAVAGTCVVAREAYPDHTAWDQNDDHFDPKASAENPIWQMVDIRLEKIFSEPLSITTLRGVAALKNMELLRKGSRLSVQPVTESEFEAVLKLAAQSPKGQVKANDQVKAADSAKPKSKAPAKTRPAERAKTRAKTRAKS